MIMATIMAGGIMIMGRPVQSEFLMENGIFLLPLSVAITVKESVRNYIKLMISNRRYAGNHRY